MSTALIDLSKKVDIILEKRKAPAIKAQVGFSVDISGSIKPLFDNGTMQVIINRIQALAIKFDSNQALDMFAFNDKAFELPTATPIMFGTYAKNHILTLPEKDLWGATLFAPVLSRIINKFFPNKVTSFVNKLFGDKTKEDPVYLNFLTDGDTLDEEATTALLESLADKAIYIQFVGIGRGSRNNFAFLKKLAAGYAHVGFVDFSEPEKTTDEEMFEKLISEEVIAWYKKVGGNNV